jgi:heme oxygenase
MQESELAAGSVSPVNSASSALGRLRAETRALHEQIEGVVPILQAGADAGTYRWYLQKLLGFHRPLEPALFATPGLASLGILRAEREKRPWLERDLRALGLSAAELEALPDCRPLPVLHGLPGALGCAYVLEGATLGAQVILRELLPRLPEVLKRASSYLRCYGAHTAARWRCFTRALEHGVPDEAAREALVTSARDTFECLQRWLEHGNSSPRAVARARALRGRVAHG